MFQIQKLDFFISFYIGCIAISELMGAKTFPLVGIGSLHLTASVGIFVVPLIYCIDDVIAEVYGKEKARSIVRSGLLIVVFFLLFTLFAIHLPPSARFLSSESAYEQVFAVSARIAAASLTAFTIAEFSDLFIFLKIRQRFGRHALWLRTNIANIISEFLDTTIFMTLAFYAFDRSLQNNFFFLCGLILPYWILKCCLSFIETPFVYFGVRWLRESGKVSK